MNFTCRQDYHIPTDYFEPTQPNPTETNRFKKSTKGDCVIRAFCLAAGISWLEAFDLLVAHARKNYDIPNGQTNYMSLFTELGYEKVTPKVIKGRKRMNVEDFCKKHRKGRYMLKVANHMTAVVDGKVRDTWNTANKCIYHYWIISNE